MLSPNLLDPRSVPETVLGVLLSSREIGLAVVSGDRLLEFGVTNLRKLRSREAREQRARRAIERLIDDYGVSRVARVIPDRSLDPTGLVASELAWLEAEATRRSLPLRAYQAADVRRAIVAPDARATNRSVAEAIGRRFEALSRYTPSAHPAAGSALVPELATRRSCVPTNRERYWARVFLAAGAAAYDLDAHREGGGAC